MSKPMDGVEAMLEALFREYSGYWNEAVEAIGETYRHANDTAEIRDVLEKWLSSDHPNRAWVATEVIGKEKIQELAPSLFERLKLLARRKSPSERSLADTMVSSLGELRYDPATEYLRAIVNAANRSYSNWARGSTALRALAKTRPEIARDLYPRYVEWAVMTAHKGEPVPLLLVFGIIETSRDLDQWFSLVSDCKPADRQMLAKLMVGREWIRGEALANLGRAMPGVLSSP